MTGVGRPLGWDEIEAYLVEVGAELEHRGLDRSIFVVGGAYVAFRGVRTSTTDVDTIEELDDELRAAVAVVAERHGLEPDWLNDRARPWRPVTFDPQACETVLRAGGLRVLAPPADIVVLMKISAGGRTPNDALDLRALRLLRNQHRIRARPHPSTRPRRRPRPSRTSPPLHQPPRHPRHHHVTVLA